MELRWRPDRTASCLHALDACLARRELTDGALQTALALDARRLGEMLRSHGIRPADFFAQAIPLAIGASVREIVQAALPKIASRQACETIAPMVSSELTHLLSLFDRQLPHLAEQLRLRVEPLRQQWEARGPGLLRQIERTTEAELLVEAAAVVLVHPVLGGAGQALCHANAVCIEAVLTNPYADLPEVVRLAWLLAQLQLDLPVYQQRLRRDQATLLGSLAMLVATLHAAQEVELARCDEATLARAIEAWEIVNHVEADHDPLASPNAGQTAGPPGLAVAVAGEFQNQTVARLLEWWSVYQDQRLEFPLALEALGRMLKP